MGDITKLLEQDFSAFITTLFVIMAGIIAMYTIASKFIQVFNLPIKWFKNNKIDHELILKNASDIKFLKEKHDHDIKQSINHDKSIKEDIKSLTSTVNEIVCKLEVMEAKIDATEMAKLKEKILGYYRKYTAIGEWEQFEADVFWTLYDRYTAHGGNSFVKDDIEPVMRKLKIKN